MIRSIRHFLLISLLISMTIASSITAIGNYLLDKQVIQPFLDEHLAEIYSFISLLSRVDPSEGMQDKISHNIHRSNNTSKNLLFQIWTPENKLLLHSKNTPQTSLKDIPLGFGDTEIQTNDWRYFAKIDPDTHNKVIVAELYDIRNQLADEITRNNGYILLVTYPIFGILIWLIVGLALRSMTRITNEISNRASTHLEPVKEENAPVEIQPLIAELNQLFIRLKLAFDRNKRFASDAAHELRTPLAALKTHAQVALKVDNQIDRNHALQKMLQGVDRSSHIVDQLLTLSRLTQSDELNDIRPIDLHKLTSEITAYLVPLALEKNIEIELGAPPNKTMVKGNDIALGILIRNIVDNAIRYTPPKGHVKIEILNRNKTVILRVTDTGPGIPLQLRERVFERFFRVLGNTTPGSGLGLAIVSQIAELHYARVSLGEPANQIGLQFDVEFPQA